MNEIEKRIPHPEASQPTETHESQPEELYKCHDCGALHPADDMTELNDGDLVCADCISAYTRCECCGEWYSLDVITITSDGTNVCEDCLSDDWFYCEDCNEWHLTNDASEVNPDTRDAAYVCSECAERNYRRCDDCGEYFDDYHISLSDAYHDICDNCANDWVRCYYCDEVLRMNDATYDELDGEYYCSNCAPERGGLHDYGYKPDPVFGTTDCFDGAAYYTGSALTFGVELECDDGDDVADAVQAIADLTNRCYCKHDGSLDDGYEIVTHPGTLAWHKKRFPWADVCKASVDNGFHSHDTSTCGLHVHVGRDQMGENSKLTAAKMALILYRLENWFVRFSRRGGASRWAKYVGPALVIDPDVNESLFVFYDQLRGDRYQAVNVGNLGTVEIRIFRGSLVPTTVLASIELVSNLVLFARDHTTAECLAVTWDELVEYEHHEELSDYCSRRMKDTRDLMKNAVPTEQPSDTYTAPDLYPGGLEAWLSTDNNSNLIPGDIVYCAMEEGADRIIVRRFGLVCCVDGRGANAWVQCAWFTPDDAFWASPTDTRFREGDARSWGARRKALRRVTRIGNRAITRGDCNQMLEMYHDTGLLPGDRVTSTELPGQVGTYLLGNGNYDESVADVMWDDFNRGHSLAGTLTGEVACHGWNRVRPESLTRV